MGLDMYLYRTLYVSEYNQKADKIQSTVEVKQKDQAESKDISLLSFKLEPQEIKERVVYWRKANAIHGFFLGENTDDCREFEVTIEQIKDLSEICTKILDDRELAPLLLPTRDGFFFGDVEYGEYYFEDIEQTKRDLERVIAQDAEAQEKGIFFDYTYFASW